MASQIFLSVGLGAVVAGLSLTPGRLGGTRHPIGVRRKTRVSFRAGPVAVEDSFDDAPGLLNGATAKFFTSSLFRKVCGTQRYRK